MQLVRADALFAAREQENRLKPEMQRNVTALENRADFDGEGLAALVALVSPETGALALHRANAVKAAAMRAHGAVRPNAGFYPRIGRFLIVKVFGRQYRLTHDALL